VIAKVAWPRSFWHPDACLAFDEVGERAAEGMRDGLYPRPVGYPPDEPPDRLGRS
jgi:hypothetical protein